MTLRQRQPRYDNPDLRRLAQEIDCTFEIPGVCIGGRGMCCHSNKAIHGKGKSKKADDQEHASSCAACHHWYDFGPASRADKDAAFELARYRTHREYWVRGLIRAVVLRTARDVIASLDPKIVAAIVENSNELLRNLAPETPASAPGQKSTRPNKALRFSKVTKHRNGFSCRKPEKTKLGWQPT